jgi:hypothetical protein
MLATPDRRASVPMETPVKARTMCGPLTNA